MIFVPRQFWQEIEQLPKAALMDIAWNYAQQIAGGVEEDEKTMAEFRQRQEIIKCYRAKAKTGAA